MGAPGVAKFAKSRPDLLIEIQIILCIIQDTWEKIKAILFRNVLVDSNENTLFLHGILPHVLGVDDTGINIYVPLGNR